MTDSPTAVVLEADDTPLSNITAGLDASDDTIIPDNGPDELTADDLALLSPEVQKELADEQKAIEAAAEAEAAATAEAERIAAEEAAAVTAAAAEKDTPQVVDTAVHQDEITAVKAERDALLQQYDEGELSADDYEKQHAALTQREVDATIVIQKAEADELAANQASAGAWDATISAHMTAYPELSTPQHNAAFDQMIKTIDAATPGLSDSDLLNQAHQRYSAFAFANGNPLTSTPADEKDPDAKAGEAGDKAVDETAKTRPAPIPTLAGAPAADSNAPTDGTFAAIDKTLGEDVFGAMDRFETMSPEQQKRYLGG